VTSSYPQDVTKLGGFIGAVTAFVLSFAVGDQIPWIRDQSDYAGNAVGVAAAVGGWVLGSWIVRRLTARRSAPLSSG
jgi:hypothetical protein